ncbi:hypothetical protein VQ02_22325 [Methylobacterium variabile]|jgi:hypothetical protein|uniref:Uncharacterized protein n=1 Tax=Methylobacterium variabile TaxID=298794 RepID=A0A0J6V295_9HYPH|nr:hypothetical protein [Methylobacterium variabile]KMO32941.1 hypothetical protein VQ02_22325 [Methylobacterium variabile]
MTMTLRTTLAWLPLAAALAAAPALAADMPAGYAARGGIEAAAGWRAPPPPPAVVAEVEAEVVLAEPPPRPLLGLGYAPVLPYYGVSTGPYGYPPRREPGIGVGLF